MTNSIYTTEQASEILGTPPGTIRQWKSRKSDQLTESVHWINQDGQTLWTDIGLEVLRSFKSRKNVTPRVTPTVTRGATGNVTPPVTDYFEPLLDAIADGLTPNLMNKLTAKVTQRLGLAVTQPCPQEVTIESAYEVLACIGITPGDCIGDLIAAGGSGLYLEGGDDEEN